MTSTLNHEPRGAQMGRLDREWLASAKGGARQAETSHRMASRARRIAEKASALALAVARLEKAGLDELARGGDDTGRSSRLPGSHAAADRAAHGDELHRDASDALIAAEKVIAAATVGLEEFMSWDLPDVTGTCKGCEGPIVGKRADAKWCSRICEGRAQRQADRVAGR